MVGETIKTYDKTYHFYVSVEASSHFLCTFLVEIQVYKIFLEYIGDFFSEHCRGIERSDFLTNQIFAVDTA